MLTSLSAVCPIFAVIAAGFIAGRLSLLGPQASSELNRFVIWLGLPAVLFQVMAQADWHTLWQPGFVAAFAIGTFVVFGATIAFRRWRGQPLTDASIDGLNAAYANAGYVGFPLCDLLFGRQSFALVTVTVILCVSVLFGVAVVLVEFGLRSTAPAQQVVLKTAKALGKNPLLVSPVLGAAWSLTGVPVPGSVQTYLHLVGAAASPCALVALGLFLAAARPANSEATPAALMLATLKLIVQPAITAALAIGIFRLPMQASAIAVLVAALPTGTGPFMLAEYYNREAVVTSKAILFSTAASVVSLSLCIAALRHFGGV